MENTWILKMNNSQQIGNIKTFNSLMGGLTTNTSSLLMGGNANFNLLSYKGVGMLEFSFGKDGIKSKIGMGGTNISYQNLRNVAAGYKEANKVTDWKYGSTETSSTLNSINMLGYTPSKDNLKLANDIWNEKLAVEYGNTGNDYGNYTLGQNKIVLSEKLLGGGREASAKLATVMSHEGTHYYGKRVEALAHLAGAETYAFLNNKFTLQADATFSMEMLAGIMNADNWKENTGDVDHWKMTWGGQLINDGQGWLIDENGMYINIDGKKSEKPIVGKTLGAGKLDENGNPIVGATGNIETGLLNILANSSNSAYSTFTDEQIKAAKDLLIGAEMTPSNPDANFKDYNWSSNGKGQKLNMYAFMETAGENVANPIFETYYNNKVDYDLATAYGLDLKFSETAMNKTVPEVLQGKYSELMSQHMQETDSPAALMNKYTWSIYDKDGVATQLYKIDENNSFLDDLVKQTDPKLDSVINEYGCNFMSTIAIPQLLTGNILKANEIQDLWNYATNQKFEKWDTKEQLSWVNKTNSYVNQPDYINNYIMNEFGYSSIKFQFGAWGNYQNYYQSGQLIGVPYGNYNPGHWTMGNNYVIYYNPGNSTGEKTIKDVYVYY